MYNKYSMKLFSNIKYIKQRIYKFLIIIVSLILWWYIIIQLIEKLAFFELIKPYLIEIYNFINYSIFVFWDINLSIITLISSSFIIFIGFTLWKYYKKAVYSMKRKRKDLSYWTITILANIWYYIIITIVLLTALKTVWIDLSNFTMILSALSVWIWFWLQTIVSNFISGIILMFEQSIKEWDYIEIWEDLRWTVLNINMRSTTIRTNNNINIIVPNQSFVENNIINWTLSDDIVRFKIPFWVAYWTKIKDVENAILWNLKKSFLPYIKDKSEKSPKLIMTDMWDNSVNFFLVVWVKGNDAKFTYVTKSKFLRLIYESLNEFDISIPFPQRDLHIKDSIPVNININKNDLFD